MNTDEFTLIIRLKRWETLGREIYTDHLKWWKRERGNENDIIIVANNFHRDVGNK